MADRLAWGSDWPGEDRLFTREDGTEVPGQWTSTRFEILAYRAGVPPVRFHDLRHGTASLLKAAGVDTKIISTILGHARSDFTDRQYVSVFPEVAAAAAAAADALVPRAATAPASREGGEVTAPDSLGVAVAWPYETPDLRTEAPLPDLIDPSDLCFRVFESVRIRFQHVARRTC